METIIAILGIVMPVIGGVIVAIIGANVKRTGEKQEANVSSALAAQNTRLLDLESANETLRSEITSLKSQHRDCMARLEQTLDIIDDMKERALAKRVRKSN